MGYYRFALFPLLVGFFSCSSPPSSASLLGVPAVVFTLTTAPPPPLRICPSAFVQSTESLLIANLKIRRPCQISRLKIRNPQSYKTHLPKSSESIISRCFSRRALVASFPASVNSSSRLLSTGFQESLLAVSTRGAAMAGAGACGIDAPIAAF